eukprot:1400081-Amphidinium_carterae.1
MSVEQNANVLLAPTSTSLHCAPHNCPHLFSRCCLPSFQRSSSSATFCHPMPENYGYATFSSGHTRCSWIQATLARNVLITDNLCLQGAVLLQQQHVCNSMMMTTTTTTTMMMMMTMMIMMMMMMMMVMMK